MPSEHAHQQRITIPAAAIPVNAPPHALHLLRLYSSLWRAYGPQGWWPVQDPSLKDRGGYHPGDYSYPRAECQRFETAIGAILTQNTAWKNVEMALANLHALDAVHPRRLLSLGEDRCREAIRSTGYYNVKAKKIAIYARYHQALKGRTPSRDELLSLWGVGPETADSILLYAYGSPEFVVDTYTRRILMTLGLVGKEAAYNDIKRLFENSVKRDVPVYQEFHALLVAHGKEHEDGCAFCARIRKC